MENLNKENYFTEDWKNKYPKTSKKFCTWIDKYKVEVEWRALFNERIGFSPATSNFPPKFHDIPIEMQLGILARFFMETNRHYTTLTLTRSAFSVTEVKFHIDHYFHQIELQLP